MKKIIIPLLFIVMISEIHALTIPNDAIRFRVIANSNSKIDQKMKLKVKDKVEKRLFNNMFKSNNIKDAKENIIASIPDLEKDIRNLFQDEKYLKTFSVNYGKNYFPKKTYQGITYDAGYYESLVVTLGKGKGKNWWCVLFPPFCLVEAKETKKENKVEYKFFLKELIDKYF